MAGGKTPTRSFTRKDDPQDRALGWRAGRDHRDGTGAPGDGHQSRTSTELIVGEVPTHLRERHDPESGLALIPPQELTVGQSG